MSPMFRAAPVGVFVGLGWVYAFIAASSAVAMAIPKVRRSQALRAPILGWWPVSVVGTLGVCFGPLPSAVVLGAVSVALYREALALVGLPPRLHRALLVAGAAVALAAHGAMLIDGAAGSLLALGLPLVLVPAAQLVLEGSDGFTRNAGGAQWVMLSTVGLFSFGMRLLVSDLGGPYGAYGAGFVFFLLVMLSDALQWLGGKLLGRHALIPRVSPKKTWEGFLFGAAACAAVGALIARPMMGLSRPLGAALGASVVALGLLGDLIASGWKRDAGVKDSGAVIPGQGGVLDRCDSILFVAPWFYAFATSLPR